MRVENGKAVFVGEQVAIDGVDATYRSVCRSCYKKEKRRVLSRKNVSGRLEPNDIEI